MIRHVNKSYLERGIMRVKLKPQLVKKWESLILARTERCLVIFNDVDNVHGLSVPRSYYRMVTDGLV